MRGAAHRDTLRLLLVSVASSDDLKTAEQAVRRGLQELTGFEYAVFTPTGTAAAEMLLEVYSRPGARIGVPSVGCWTLAFAVTELKRRAHFLDVDRYWAPAVPRDQDLEVAIMLDPWGGTCDWRRARRGDGANTWLLDLTHAPGARYDGARAGEYFDGGLISFGSSKPLGLGGGGVALFNDAAAVREATRLRRFGFRDGRWQRRVGRYNYSPHLHPPLARKLAALKERTPGREVEEAAQVFAGLFETIPLRAHAERGHTTVVPLRLPARFALSPRALEAVAVTSGHSLVRYPAGPAYLEPAWGRRAVVRCAKAERLAPRLLFHVVTKDTRAVLQKLREFVEQVRSRAEEFQMPYPLGEPVGTLPSELVALEQTAYLGRSFDGAYGMLDEELGMLVPVSPAEAALLQARALAKGAHPARPPRRAGARATRRSSPRGKGSP